jgi:hypothetical protein
VTIHCSKCGAPNEDLASGCAVCGSKLVGVGAVAEAAQEIDRATKKPVGSIILLIACAIYLLNPLFGFDLLPDNLPIVGNLDEAGATYLMLTAMSGLGWITLSRRRRLPPSAEPVLGELSSVEGKE